MNTHYRAGTLRNLVGVLCAASLLTVFLPASPAEAQSADEVQKLEARHQATRGRIADLKRRFAGEAFRTPDYDVAKRLSAAREDMAADRPDRAVVALAPLVDDAAFKRSGDYAEALLLLAEAQVRVGNHDGAQTTLGTLRGVATNPGLKARATALSMESALQMERRDELQRMVAQAASEAATSPDVAYARGKALVVLGRPAEALRSLAAVPAGSPLHARARYYAGVAHVGTKDLDGAATAFSAAAAGAANSDDLRDLSNLAMARVALEQGRNEDAIKGYQQVPEESAHRPRALYELSWAYVHADRLAQALRSFDQLQLLTDQERLTLLAGMDRGRLLIQMQRFADAQATFERVLENFVPIRNELEAFAKDDDNLRLYFDWLVRRYEKEQALELPLTEKASRWVQSGDGLEKLAATFEDIATERQDIAALEALIVELKDGLASRDRVALFPALSAAWVELLVTQNRLVSIKRTALDAQYRDQANGLSAARRAQADELRAQAARLTKQLNSPQDAAAYEQHIRQVNQDYSVVEREAFQVSRALDQLRNEVVAVQRFIKELEYKSSTRTRARSVNEEVRANLMAERKKMVDLSDQLEAIERALRVEMGRTGVGGEDHRKEGAVREQLLAIYRQLEGIFRADARLKAVHANVWSDLDQVATLEGEIYRRLESESKTLLAIVSQEEANIRGYRTKIGSIDARSARIADEVGHALFRRANDQIQQTVLQADLGVVDLAWERKQIVTDFIEDTNKERAEKIKQVQALMKEMLDGPIYQPMDKRPSEDDEEDGEASDQPEGEEASQ